MNIFRNATFCLIALSCSAFASESVLQERLKKGKAGDYIVTESNKMISVLAIRSLSPQSLILEEISAPMSALDPRPASWSEWVRQRAPGHTSWSMIEIDLQNHELLECYSFSRSSWVQLASQESILSTLLGLSLQKVPENELRRIGPPPAAGDADTRKIWKPPLVEEGQRLHNIEFDVYRTYWPDDGSELAGNIVSLYFDRSNRSPFPIWIQVDTSHASASSRVVDSGKNLPAVHRTLPRRIPEFIGIPQKTPDGLRLSLKSPKYYHSFELFAVDVTTHEKKICPITHSLANGEGELLYLDIDQSELQHILQPDHRYTWLIVPAGHSEFYSESHKPFLWKPE
jgi:hypothetical protein